VTNEVYKFSYTEPERFKQQVRAGFDATPAYYGTEGDFHWEFAKRLIARAPLRPGQAVVDVATGTAPAAIMAAQIVGPAGSVIGIDISPGMLRHANRNIAAANVPNIHLQVGDAECLPFRESSFDGVLCSSAIAWFPDIQRALTEWHRVVQPGGWIAFSCFGGPARQTINDLVIQLLQS
jgi:ubiquinone/menaquinone biosynthesis C-methylase UbiE